MGHAKVVSVGLEALRIETLTATTMVPWRYVSEVVRDRKYLLFVVAGMAYFVPRRFFRDADAEAAFIAEALARLTPEARLRSDVPGDTQVDGRA